MKTFFILLFTILFCRNINANELLVNSFKYSIADLSASINRRISNSGSPCALIKVVIPYDNLTFEGNIVGDVIYENSTYWVYVDENSEFLTVRCGAKTNPLTLYFEDWPNVKQIEAKRTYILTLSLDIYDYKKEYSLKFDGMSNGYQYVDLGLSVKWATCNLGATTPEKSGNKYAWGETHTKSSFSWDNYAFGTGDEYSYSKYDNDDSEETSQLALADDVVYQKMGAEWRIPSMKEIIELYSSCTFILANYNGVNGYVVTGPNGNAIFLPLVFCGEKKEIHEPDHDVLIKEVESTSYASSSAFRPSADYLCSIILSLDETAVGIDRKPVFKESVIRPIYIK